MIFFQEGTPPFTFFSGTNLLLKNLILIEQSTFQRYLKWGIIKYLC
jgi:hypothetical protein